MRKIEELRRARGLSLAALSRLAEMHPTTVGQIEKGYIGKPYPSQMSKLANALGVPTDHSDELLEEVLCDE